MVLHILHCPPCQGTDIVRHGHTRQGNQRYRCREQRCAGRTFLLDYSYNRLRVFRIANTVRLGRGVGQERWWRMGPSENYVARGGNMLDEMRMKTACFARALQRCTSRLSKHFSLTFQEVTPLSKTRNQLDGIASSRLKTRWQAGEEHSSKCRSLFQQNPKF